MSEENRIISVSGFSFENPAVGEEALKEQEAIEYVSNQINMQDTRAVLNLYNQMIARRMFHTQVGYAYLKELQDYLMKCNIDPASIETIPVESQYFDEIDGSSSSKVDTKGNERTSIKEASYDKKPDVGFRAREKKLSKKANRYMKLSITFIVISIALVITVVAMFIIAGTSNNPTILNYEEVIQNKYAAWEEDLQAREDALKKQENAINIR